ncbi:MAG TPA: discoidin domain-containing protein [Opitutus sp.]|nr:discoidin domain-containing protein [Opitutus sp.]
MGARSATHRPATAQSVRYRREYGRSALDADASTYWKVPATTGSVPRRTLTVDMGGPQRIAGFAYLPRQDWSSESAVDRCRFETSLDGTTWTTQVKEQHFGNMRNNPILQEVRFATVEARFFRFTALHDLDDNGWVGAAEITVLPASASNEP